MLKGSGADARDVPTATATTVPAAPPEQPEHGRFDQQLATQPTWRGAERGPARPVRTDGGLARDQ